MYCCIVDNQNFSMSKPSTFAYTCNEIEKWKRIIVVFRYEVYNWRFGPVDWNESNNGICISEIGRYNIFFGISSCCVGATLFWICISTIQVLLITKYKSPGVNGTDEKNIVIPFLDVFWVIFIHRNHARYFKIALEGSNLLEELGDESNRHFYSSLLSEFDDIINIA